LHRVPSFDAWNTGEPTQCGALYECSGCAVKTPADRNDQSSDDGTVAEGGDHRAAPAPLDQRSRAAAADGITFEVPYREVAQLGMASLDTTISSPVAFERSVDGPGGLRDVRRATI
jgi:hypothetical protein